MDHLENVLNAKGYSAEEIKGIRSDYLSDKGRVRRGVPNARDLEARLEGLLELFRDIDPTLVTDKVLNQHNRNMEHVRLGCLSDHPDVNLFLEYQKTDSKTHESMRICRGTSQLEGWHRHVKDGVSGQTIELALFNLQLHCLTDRWNVDAAVKCRLMPNMGIYDRVLLDDLYQLYLGNEGLFEVCPFPPGFIPTSAREIQENFGCDIPRNAVLLRPFLNQPMSSNILEENDDEPEPDEDAKSEATSEPEHGVLEDMEMESSGELLKLMKYNQETELLDQDEDFVLRLPQPSAALKEKILSCQTCLPIRTQQGVDL
jgi:hypothetical protein